MKGHIMLALLILLITFGVLRGLSDKNGKIWLQCIIVNIWEWIRECVCVYYMLPGDTVRYVIKMQ